MTSKIIYLGNLRTEATFVQSGNTITTDSSIEHGGKGEHFSSSDLVATALASCMITIMSAKAKEINIDLKGTELRVEKIMDNAPLRIKQINIYVDFPDKLSAIAEATKTTIEHAGISCPVARSLHPDILQQINFSW